MRTIDWLLIFLPLLTVLAIAVYTQRYVKSVTDFLSGGRMAGRYLLAVSRGEQLSGAVVFVALFEIISQSGFTVTCWWSFLYIPVTVITNITGFVVYRYRETRAQTLAQFFEIRYSKGFRVFTGVLGFLAGLLNFGIIPAVGARFFAYFLGMPPSVAVGPWQVPAYVLLMAVFLTITAILPLAGGLVTILVTDCVQGIFSQLLYLVIVASLLSMFHWSQISEALSNRPPGQSLMNPFDSAGLKDFNLWFVLMGIFLMINATMAWQNNSGYNSASFTAHESRMGYILGTWREWGKTGVVTLLGVCAVTYLHHPHFAAQAALVRQEVSRIPQAQIQEQMQAPIALAHLLPPGVKGALCVIMLMGIFGGDATHLHSWGRILVQDVLLPLRKTPFTPVEHMRALRLSVAGVAVFAFVFGTFFTQTEYVQMWWTVTSSIFVGGAGSAIIGGLYWKKGTAAGAWVALITGSVLSLSGIAARQVDPAFPLNGQEIGFLATLVAITLYICISLLTCREDFNLDRMLHRGAYAAIPALVGDAVPAPPHRHVWLGRLIGIDEDFTRGDKWIAGGQFAWGMGWFFIYLAGTIWNLIAPWPPQVWSGFWKIVGIEVPVFLTIVTGIWFTWGGLRDMRSLFRRLRDQHVNPLDNGTVVGHQNQDESVLAPEKVPGEEVRI